MSYELLQERRKRGDFLVGAAIGAGAFARAATRGGADFLEVLNAGRFRLMGAPSITCMMPVRNANSFVLDVMAGEITPLANIPVFFGASVMDSEDDLAAIVDRVALVGGHGVINFPTACHYPRSIQRALEDAGIGFSRELKLLSIARSHGLAAIAHVTTGEQARQAAAEGIEIVCFNYGWNAGGVGGVTAVHNLMEAAAISIEVRRLIRSVNPDTLLMLEGGPIKTAQDLKQILAVSHADGYIGGSTFDRLAFEDAVTNQTLTFKDAARSLTEDRTRERDLSRRGRTMGLVGASKALLSLLERVDVLSRSRVATIVTGEAASGRQRVVEAIVRLQPGGAHDIVTLHCEEYTAAQLIARLFGKEAASSDIALLGRDNVNIVLRGLELIPLRAQKRLAFYLEQGAFRPAGARRPRAGHARLMFVADLPLDELQQRGLLHPHLARQLAGVEVRLPPVRERAEDVEDLMTQAFEELRERGPRPQFSPAALRRLRLHSWVGNLAEVQSVAAHLLAEVKDGRISETDVAAALEQEPSSKRRTIGNERDIILDALWRNAFHRGRTAQFLGITRKTLYNKIVRFGINQAAK
jgi:predicted TIM-barrel enzyme/DNA-binding NtrC family response regulator